jgi:short-subunit dehydrogenase
MKKAIVIGATSGIGKSIADMFVRQHYQVGIAGRRLDLLEAAKDRCPDNIVYRQLDVQNSASIEPVCNELVQELGGLDVLVISAGIGEANKHLDSSIENKVIATNIQGFTGVATWGMRYFKNQGYGHLVNISSIAGLRGNGLAPSYNATKAFQINYLEGLRLNAVKSGTQVYVTDVRPGFVDTDMAKGDGLFWVAPVEKAAQQIVEAINSRKQVVYITRRWNIIALLMRVLPYSLWKRM